MRPRQREQRILFVTDTHLGAGVEGFQQQPRRVDLAGRIYEGLRQTVRRRSVDLVVHGGDLVETGTPEEIRQAAELLGSLGAPVALSLGNHDLGATETFALWQQALWREPVDLADTVVALDGLDVILLNNAWSVNGRAGLFWDPSASWHEALLKEQREWLEQALASAPDRPALLVVHAPLDAIPPRLSGGPEPLHSPHPGYAALMAEILGRHSRVRLVLSGHNHVTLAVRHEGRVHLTTSSLIETPFEYRLISYDGDRFAVETVAAIRRPAGVGYDAARAWVNGQPSDRSCVLSAR